MASRPLGVRGAFLWLFIWSLRGTLKLHNLSFLGSDQMDNLLKDHTQSGVTLLRIIIPHHLFCLSMISAQTLRVCREGKPLHTFPDHAQGRVMFSFASTRCT